MKIVKILNFLPAQLRNFFSFNSRQKSQFAPEIIKTNLVSSKAEITQKSAKNQLFSLQQNLAKSSPKIPEPAEIIPDFIDAKTGRHTLDVIYECFSKPQLYGRIDVQSASIYVRHEEGQIVQSNYKVEKVFEDPGSGFYAEGRVPIAETETYPVLVIRGYGSWYPFERVIEDTPDVIFAGVKRHFKAAEKVGALSWLKEKTEQGNPADVIGDSLGGKIAQQLAAKYPEYIRSTVTFNSLGVDEKTAQNSHAQYVFHYFTLGEKYAFWANRGAYIPGKCFMISKAGKNWRYQLAETIISKAPFSLNGLKKHTSWKRWFQIVLGLLAQVILLKRHNDLILSHSSAVVLEVELSDFLGSSLSKS